MYVYSLDGKYRQTNAHILFVYKYQLEAGHTYIK